MVRLGRIGYMVCFLLAAFMNLSAQNTGYSPNYIGTGNGCISGGTCYYVDYVNGSDSNDGLAKVPGNGHGPWKSAPGMACATGNVASHTPSSTDEIILRGGETWPFSCFPWMITSGGANSPNSYSYPGMYIGYDPTWNTAAVVHIVVSDPGVCSSDVALTVSITSGGGSGAAATANVETDGFTAIGDLEFVTVTNSGSGYTSNPSVSFSPTAGSCSQLPTAYADIYSPVLDGSAGVFGSGGAIPQMFYITAKYATVDHLEFRHYNFSGTNQCPSNAPNMLNGFASNITFQNLFIHDFKVSGSLANLVGNCDSSQTSAVYMNGASAADVFQNNVLNNYESEASGCIAKGSNWNNCAQSTAINEAQFDVNNIYTVWRGGVYSASGNSTYVNAGNKMWGFLHDANSQHGDTFYLHGGGLTYNNILRDIFPGTAAFYIETGDGSAPTMIGNQHYLFNNVVWNIGTSTQPISFSSEFVSNSATSASPTPDLRSWNNTLVSYQGNTGCDTAGQYYGNSPALSMNPGFNLTLYNNQCISTQGADHWYYDTGSCQNGCSIWNVHTGPNSSSTEKVIDPLNIIDTPQNANSQGYTATDNYAPTASTNDTVVFANSGNSQNLTSLCSTSLNGLSLTALCSDINGNPRPATGGWQAGAYWFNGDLQQPAAPTGLTAVVQ